MASQEPLTKDTLKRLRALAKGNEIAPESIQLVENKENIYTIHGYIQLTARSSHRSREKYGRIKSKNGQVLPSFEALTNKIANIEKEAQEGSGWIEPALQELEKMTGHGWGHRDSHLSWSDQETVLLATENCRDCNGSGQHPCQECKGQGSTPCYHCQGRGQELCLQCQGSGQDPSNQGSPCPICHGTRYQTCRICHGKRVAACRVCGSKGYIKCPSCRGAGCISREVRMRSGADISFGLKSTSGLPSGLLRSMSRIGEENIYKGHADIKLKRPDPETKSQADKARIILEAKVPYAEIKIRFGDTGSVISCFGKKGRLTGVPAFLDKALEVTRSYLGKASKGEMAIEKALGPRLMQDALKLTLAGKNHPNFLRRFYPVGLTGGTAKEIMKNMSITLKHETMKVRTIVAALCTVLSVGTFAGVFLTPFYEWALAEYKVKVMLAGEIALPLMALAITWVTLHSFAQMVLKRRFPSAKIMASPKLGARGYTALVIITLSYIAMIGYAKMSMG